MARSFRAVVRLCAACLALAAATLADAQRNPFSDMAKSAADSVSAGVEVDASCAGYTGNTKAACEASAKAAFDHQVWLLQYRERAYEAHHRYTLWVFVLVCALVVLGMYLSLREFNLDSRRREALIAQLTKRLKRLSGQKGQDSAAEHGDGGASTSTTLGIDATGVKVTSPVLGVIILVLSMGFFYLYLKTVYPINEATVPEPAARPAQAANPPQRKE
jgi:hypothetical protein